MGFVWVDEERLSVEPWSSKEIAQQHRKFHFVTADSIPEIQCLDPNA